ncbi:MAG TPA: hypothetical protein VLF21_02505 [Candidatus Saccharimonadales bacterium]|nr:hypothetical protein [Candidatus Saccharimonadales bacterium]
MRPAKTERSVFLLSSNKARAVLDHLPTDFRQVSGTLRAPAGAATIPTEFFVGNFPGDCAIKLLPDPEVLADAPASWPTVTSGE